MRVKPIFKYGLVAGALALPQVAYPLGLGRLTIDSFVGQPLVARIELLSTSKEELDTLSAQHCGSFAVPAKQSAVPGCPFARPHYARARSQRHRVPSRHVERAGHRAVSRPAGRSELGRGPRRSRLHVPARSSGSQVATAVEPITPMRTGTPVLTEACRLRRLHRRRAARRAGAARSRRHVRSEARRHAVQDRQGIQARDGDARPDARRAVQEQRRTRSTAAT